MTSAVQNSRRIKRHSGSLSVVPGADVRFQPIKSNIPFCIFLVYMISFYLHLPARIPAIASIRPDLMLAIFLLFSLFPYYKDKVSLLGHPIARGINIFVAFVFISLPFVEWPGSVLRGNLQPFLKAVLFLYFAILAVDTPRRLRLFLFVLLACQIIRILEPLYLNLTEGYLGSRTHLGSNEFAGRLSGAPSDVINPNGLGFVIATTAVFIHFVLGQSRSWLNKLIYAVLLPAMLYALILTMSRGAFLALLVGAWVIFLQSRHKITLILAAIAIGLAGWSIMSDVQQDRYISLVSSQAEQRATAEGRLRGMAGEFRLGFNRPLFGHGVGTTPEAKANFGRGNQAAHSLYAELMIETGLIGLFLFLFFIRRVQLAVKSNLALLANTRGLGEKRDFYSRLGHGIHAVFWVYAVYSLNYFGVSQDYWYVLGGLCVAFAVIVNEEIRRLSSRVQGSTNSAP